MRPDRWNRIQELFHHAAELPPERREAFLRRSCGDDETLIAEVRSLLEHDPEPDDRRRRLPPPGGRRDPHDPEI